MKLDNINAVVTGGATGIGRAVVEALVANGCSVVIADVDIETATQTANELGDKVSAIQCNVRDTSAIAQMAKTAWDLLGGVDFVFANAGVIVSANMLEATDEIFNFIFEVNVRGSWSTLANFGRLMVENNRGGHLCVTGSEHSVGVQHLGAGLYTGSKHAVLGWADVLRGELPDNIKMSVLCPGIVNTQLFDSTRNSELPAPKDEELAMGAAMMKRGMPASECAQILIRGIEDDSFIIPTHPMSYPAAEKRFDELKDAWQKYADPKGPDADKYDIPRLAEAAMAELKLK